MIYGGVVDLEFVRGMTVRYKAVEGKRFKVSHRIVEVEECSRCGQIYWLRRGPLTIVTSGGNGDESRQ